jgi:hypothetical protein
MFEKELAFFIQNQEELVSRFGGQFLILRDSEVAGVYPSPIEAYVAALKQFKPGTFMIQPCMPGPSAYTVTISSYEVAS